MRSRHVVGQAEGQACARIQQRLVARRVGRAPATASCRCGSCRGELAAISAASAATAMSSSSRRRRRDRPGRSRAASSPVMRRRREHQLLGRRTPDPLGQPHRHAPHRHEAPLAVGVAELGRLRGDQQVAAERQFEPAGEAVPFDLGDRRLRAAARAHRRSRVRSGSTAPLAARRSRRGRGRRRTTGRRRSTRRSATVSSPASASRWPRNATNTAGVSALSLSGRLRVSVATPSASSRRTSSSAIRRRYASPHPCGCAGRRRRDRRRHRGGFTAARRRQRSGGRRRRGCRDRGRRRAQPRQVAHGHAVAVGRVAERVERRGAEVLGSAALGPLLRQRVAELVEVQRVAAAVDRAAGGTRRGTP